MERPDHIGADKLVRSDYGAVHMRLRGHIDNGARAIGHEYFANESAISDISLDEGIARVPAQFIKIQRVGRIS